MALNLPDALSLSRVPLAALLLYLSWIGDWQGALAVLIAIVLTDIADGWLARRWRQESQRGKMLDILVDYSLVSVLIPVLAAMRSGQWLMVLLMVPLSLIGLYYYQRLKKDTDIAGTKLGKPVMSLVIFLTYVALIVGRYWVEMMLIAAVLFSINNALFLAGRYRKERDQEHGQVHRERR